MQLRQHPRPLRRHRPPRPPPHRQPRLHRSLPGPSQHRLQRHLLHRRPRLLPRQSPRHRAQGPRVRAPSQVHRVRATTRSPPRRACAQPVRTHVLSAQSGLPLRVRVPSRAARVRATTPSLRSRACAPAAQAPAVPVRAVRAQVARVRQQEPVDHVRQQVPAVRVRQQVPAVRVPQQAHRVQARARRVAHVPLRA